MSFSEPITISLDDLFAAAGVVGVILLANAVVGGVAVFTNYTPIGRALTGKKKLLPVF